MPNMKDFIIPISSDYLSDTRIIQNIATGIKESQQHAFSIGSEIHDDQHQQS